MAKLTLSIKLCTISLLLFAASSSNFVNSAAVHSGRPCGYGKKCHQGYKCVKKNSNVRTCQKIESHAPPTPTSGPFSTSKPEHTPVSVPQSGDIHTRQSSGYVTKSSGYPSNRPSTKSHSTASPPPSKRSDGLPPTASSGHSSKHSGTSTSRPTATGHASDPPDSGKNFTAVVGVPGKIVERRPIDVVKRDDPDVFNMMLLAFESIQNTDESEDLSYYQLSGIHGYPFISWQYPPKNPAPQLGYCTHASSIFTTWHRPYVILLEQILHGKAVSIAKLYTGPDASKYQAAADKVRLPYWDWASDDTDSHLPSAVVDATVAVVKPGSAGLTTIPNPLYNYHRRDTGRATVRADTADGDLVATFADRQSLTNALFTDTAYDGFSFNLEDIHNLVHVLVGGDMVDIATAAYDPIFWFHHCNVDRLMAIYQASHPNLYLTPAPRSPTYALSGPGPDDLSTPLYPFRHPDAREWTSDDVKTAESIFEYGYAYPEVPSGQTGDALRTFSIQKVNELYGPKTDGPSFQGEESGVPAQSDARREWSANVVVDSTELPGSQQIRLFIGTNNSRSFSKDDLAGVAAIFSSNLTTEGSANRLLNITVPLTQTLVDKNVGLRPEDVVPKLANDLHWAVEQVGDANTPNTPIPVQDLKSLQISVSSQIAKYPDDKTKLPIKSASETFLAPTNDKIGGLKAGEVPPVGKIASNPASDQTTNQLS